MNQWADIFQDEYRFALADIEYHLCDDSSRPPSLKLEENTTIDISAYSALHLTVKRSVFFEPESVFRLSVTFKVDLLFVEGFKPGKDQEAAEYWPSFIMDHGGVVMGNIFSRMSLIIAQITSLCGNAPLITSNTFLNAPVK